jgi:CRISPR-associated endonuclease/helicase Cas3
LTSFSNAFAALQGDPPFPWQERLFQKFSGDEWPTALDLPTGLGKTSVMVIWYLAFKAGASVPRRLVYVVDRRAVVDQATTVAEKIRKQSGDAAVHVSTLRGQLVDNREWLSDPISPAIVVGTIDMIGSRLLFSGYGVSPKMRPYHAGLLGVDTLVVLDEAHLVPPFEALLRTIADDPKGELRPCLTDGAVVPAFRLMSLSATGRDIQGEPFGLSAEDYKHQVILQRLKAPKHLTIEDQPDKKDLPGRLAERAWTLGSQLPARVLVYCHSRTDALAVKIEIDEQLAKQGYRDSRNSELLVGERRVHEREALFGWLGDRGFIGEAMGEPQQPAFLVATAAGEVGVDLDADHMVCDLVEWERMVQRLGRVNRRGRKQARIEVIAVPSKHIKLAEEWSRRLTRLRAPVEALNGDASPAAIVAVKANEAHGEALRKAQTPAPLRPALTRALVDAWSMTSLEEHTGRPEIQPWLRGWIDEQPQTAVIWRRYLPPASQNLRSAKIKINRFFEAAAPQMSEILEAARWDVADCLLACATRVSKSLRLGAAGAMFARSAPALVILDQKNEIEGSPWTFDQLISLAEADKKKREAFEESITGRTLVVSSRLGGLNKDGMLDKEFDGEPTTIDDDGTWAPAPPFRVRATDELTSTCDENWEESFRLAVERNDADDETRWLVVEQRQNEAESEEGRGIARKAQLLSDHQQRVEQIAKSFASALALPADYVTTLAVAARLHDEGKKALRWQRAFSAPDGAVYAKTKGPLKLNMLGGYRHEFGSLAYVESDPGFRGLPSDLRDLALHLVATHHGGGRPLISTSGCEDAPPSALEVRAREVTLRFDQLQRRWGPWGLAWWEALLRAADQHASAENDTSA